MEAKANTMLTIAVNWLIHEVLPAAADYAAAERTLSEAYKADKRPAIWEAQARNAKRRAAQLAIAIDGLTDRSADDLKMTKANIRKEISALCELPGATTIRDGAHDRIRGVANAYKHQKLSDVSLPIDSDDDILVIGLGYGLDGFGVGKFGGAPEVLVRERSGKKLKFLGDAPAAIAAWFRFLAANGAILPPGTHMMWGLQLYP